jgi:hypothetical protein
LNKENLMNRKLIEIPEAEMARLEQAIANDPAVQKAGFCPK